MNQSSRVSYWQDGGATGGDLRGLLCWHHSRGSLDEGCPGRRKRLEEAGMGPRDVRLGCREVPSRPQRVSCPRGHESRAAANGSDARSLLCSRSSRSTAVPDNHGRRWRARLVCKHWSKFGACKFGASCQFLHPAESAGTDGGERRGEPASAGGTQAGRSWQVGRQHGLQKATWTARECVCALLLSGRASGVAPGSHWSMLRMLVAELAAGLLTTRPA